MAGLAPVASQATIDYATALRTIQAAVLGNANRLTELEISAVASNGRVGVLETKLAELAVDVRSEIKLKPSQCRALADAVRAKVQASGASGGARSARFSRIWRGLKNKMDVEQYREIPRHLYNKAMAIVASYDPVHDCFSE